jgi:hypothetical protein
MMEHTQQFKQILIKGLRTNRRAGRNRMAAGRVLQLRPQPNKGHPRGERIDRKQATRGGRAAKLLFILYVGDRAVHSSPETYKACVCFPIVSCWKKLQLIVCALFLGQFAILIILCLQFFHLILYRLNNVVF